MSMWVFEIMEEDYKDKIRIKLDKDDLSRLIKGETIVGYKTAIQLECTEK